MLTQDLLTMRVAFTELRQPDSIDAALAPYAPRSPTALTNVLLVAFDNEKMSDVSFCFSGGRRIYAQKAILMASSDYFRSSTFDLLLR
jgi:hypothetical protein